MEQTERKLAMEHIYTALVERGYRPVDQIIGYILTDDPTYITNHNGARRRLPALTVMPCCAICSQPIFPLNDGKHLELHAE